MDKLLIDRDKRWTMNGWHERCAPTQLRKISRRTVTMLSAVVLTRCGCKKVAKWKDGKNGDTKAVRENNHYL
jgi:hypothetical protein